MLQYLNADEKNRFATLQQKLAQLLITEAEQSELRSLVGKAQQLASVRSQAIDTVKRLIAENGIAASEVFSAEDLRKSAAPRGEGRGAAAKLAKVSKTPKSSRKSEQVLIQVKLDKSAGAPSRYKLGQKLGKVVSKNFKQLDVNGQLMENLLKYATPLGKAHFATAAGHAELEAFAAFVRKTPVAG